jgi:NAD(P)H-flavin reductase
MATPLRAERIAPMTPAPYRVVGARQDTPDVFTLDLEPRGGGDPIALRPGQFSMLYVFGIGEVPISVSGDLTRPGPIVHTVRSVGITTRALCAAEVGTVLGVRGPFGTAWPVELAEGADLVLVAGGIGLAPLRPVIYHVLANRERYGRLVLLYGSRTPADLLFVDELEHWADLRNVDISITVDAAGVDWVGQVGLVTRLIDGARFASANAVAMVCGPEIMMHFTARALIERGVLPERLYVSMERNMQCAVGLCGHCQLGTKLICRDGAVFPYPAMARLMEVREL